MIKCEPPNAACQSGGFCWLYMGRLLDLGALKVAARKKIFPDLQLKPFIFSKFWDLEKFFKILKNLQKKIEILFFLSQIFF